jgi:TonB family protein
LSSAPDALFDCQLFSFRIFALEMPSSFLTRHLIPCLLLIIPLNAQAGRVKVALVDNEPVYHWTNFTSVVHNDVDRALILRDFQRQGLHLPEHFVNEAVQKKINQDYGGDKAKLLEDLKSNDETLASYRQFVTEEIILAAMRLRETKQPKNGHPPPSEAEWLESLRRGKQIRMIGMASQRPTTEEARGSDEAALLGETKADLLAMPVPEYPYVARRDYLQGKGLYLLRFNPGTGLVREVTVIHSSGHAILDQAALRALHQWRIKPHTFEKIKVPFTFELDGKRAALLRALGPNLLYAVQPHYPLAASAHGVTGRGQFQLLINPSTGLVTDVQILETTHDQRLDAAAVKAFRQWRFRPRTLQKLVVPIDFSIRYG